MKKTITTFSLLIGLVIVGFISLPQKSEAKIRFHVDIGLGISSGYNGGYYPYDPYNSYGYRDYTGYGYPYNSYNNYGYDYYPTRNNYGYNSYSNYSSYNSYGYGSNYYNSGYGSNNYRYLPTCDYC